MIDIISFNALIFMSKKVIIICLILLIIILSILIYDRIKTLDKKIDFYIMMLIIYMLVSFQLIHLMYLLIKIIESGTLCSILI